MAHSGLLGGFYQNGGRHVTFLLLSQRSKSVCEATSGATQQTPTTAQADR